ncbi:MAG: thioester-forming surface-anchored protein, partial [Anaerovoracaceae bacterium]
MEEGKKSKKRKWLHQFMAIMIAVFSIVNVFPSMTVHADNSPTVDTTKYQAFTNGGFRHSGDNWDVYSSALFIRQETSKDTGANSAIGYCFNSHQAMPPEITFINAGFDSVLVRARYERKMDVSDIYSYADNPAIPKEAFNKKVRQIVYNGYETNGSGFNSGDDAIKLSEFRRATQVALWAYTDGGPGMNIDNSVNGFSSSAKERNILRKLLEANNEVPDNFVVDLYVSDTQGMQSLISGRIDNTITPK